MLWSAVIFVNATWFIQHCRCMIEHVLMRCTLTLAMLFIRVLGFKLFSLAPISLTTHCSDVLSMSLATYRPEQDWLECFEKQKVTTTSACGVSPKRWSITLLFRMHQLPTPSLWTATGKPPRPPAVNMLAPSIGMTRNGLVSSSFKTDFISTVFLRIDTIFNFSAMMKPTTTVKYTGGLQKVNNFFSATLPAMNSVIGLPMEPIFSVMNCTLFWSNDHVNSLQIETTHTHCPLAWLHIRTASATWPMQLKGALVADCTKSTTLTPMTMTCDSWRSTSPSSSSTSFLDFFLDSPPTASC